MVIFKINWNNFLQVTVQFYIDFSMTNSFFYRTKIFNFFSKIISNKFVNEQSAYGATNEGMQCGYMSEKMYSV